MLSSQRGATIVFFQQLAPSKEERASSSTCFVCSPAPKRPLTLLEQVGIDHFLPPLLHRFISPNFHASPLPRTHVSGMLIQRHFAPGSRYVRSFLVSHPFVDGLDPPPARFESSCYPPSKGRKRQGEIEGGHNNVLIQGDKHAIRPSTLLAEQAPPRMNFDLPISCPPCFPLFGTPWTNWFD
jgi:hypothetical protein